jgi:cytidylate kinase
MSDNLIITIGRECGAGGRSVAAVLGEKYGIKVYDEELLDLAVKESGLARELFEMHDERPNRSFLYNLVMDTYSMNRFGDQAGIPVDQRIFIAQSNAIKKLADEESCIIIGRCADYVLSDYPNHVSVFLSGDDEVKIPHMAQKYGVDEKEAKSILAKTDKRRASYYNFYTSRKWGASDSYDLCINTSKIGFEGAAGIIECFIENRK